MKPVLFKNANYPFNICCNLLEIILRLNRKNKSECIRYINHLLEA